MRINRTTVCCLVTLTLGVVHSAMAFDSADLERLSTDILTEAQRGDAAGMINRDIGRRTALVNARNRAEWAKINSREQWETFRDERIEALRRSLGDYPPPVQPHARVTGTIEGDGFRIENVIYESRRGVWVTGNLYAPAKPTASMPGIVLVHSHHRDKPQSELQDMGMTWARAGCLVLVIDQVGHGERRMHPFQRTEDYPQPFAASRQDYRFRYDSGMQLHLIGDSLMGWMVYDLMRGVDVLLAREGIDPARIIVLGAVAGGGDPAGVLAALDHRIAGCVPFNFGGPQPESQYPLPDDVENSFNLLCGAHWETTRGLRLGGQDDFLHWVIVASTAPRRLIHAHEFSWGGQREPVWQRYQKIWGDFYGAADSLGVAYGKGTVRQQASEASHCTNIGRFHRQMIHPLFERWFNIKVTEVDEYSEPRKAAELACWTESARSELKPQSLLEIMTAIGAERIAVARRELAEVSPSERKPWLRHKWSQRLGPVTPTAAPVVLSTMIDPQPVAGMTIQRIRLEVEPGIVVPMLLLGSTEAQGRLPVVVGVSQAGKAEFVKNRAAELQRLVHGGVLVALPDLRGTGESRSGKSRGLDSAATNQSVNLQLFGETLVGQRLRDLRCVLAYLRTSTGVDAQRVALWGDSFTPPNSPDADFRMPRGIDGWPSESEPLGGLLAMLGALFEDDVRAVYVAGSLNDYHSVLTHFAVLVPHDAMVPGAFTCGDLGDLAGCLAPMPLRFEALVDHLNRSLPIADMQRSYAPTTQAYAAAPQAFSLAEQRSNVAEWLLDQLK